MGRQKELSGVERETIKEIDDAAEAYVEARDKRMALTKKEVDAKDALIAVMRTHRRKVYKDENASPPLVVTLKDGKATVKVQTADGVPGGEPEGDDGES